MSNVLNDRLLKSFFNAASADRLCPIQTVAFASEGYDPAAKAICQLESRLTTARPTDLIGEVESLPWFFQVCPRFHFVEARIRENLGEIEAMQHSVERMQSCLRALMQTGSGSRQSPFSVTFLTDQRDMLRVIGESLRCQQLVEGEDRCYDVLTTHSGDDVWFDVTPLWQQGTIAHARQRRLVADHPSGW